MATTPKTKGDIVFAATGRKPGDGTRVTRISGGKVELLTSTNPDKWSELAAVITGAPVEPPVTPVVGIMPAAFAAKLAAAKPGDTMRLAGGNFGPLNLSTVFSATLTIAAADPASPPIFTGLNMNGAQNVTFDGVRFDYMYRVGEPIYQSPFAVYNSQDIAFKNCTFDGDIANGANAADNGFPTGRGLVVQGSDRVTVADCTVKTWHRGLVFDRCNNVAVLRNDVTAIRSDGMDFAQVTGVMIEGNHIHDFTAPAVTDDHPDMIQFFTTGTDKPSTDIVIRGNLLDVAAGSWTETIFMRNELVDQGKATIEAMGYRNVLIENNTIRNAHLHGITVGESLGLAIRKNAITAATLNPADPANAAYLAKYGAAHGIMSPSINMSAPSKGDITGNALVTAGAAAPGRVNLNGAAMAATGNTTDGAIPAGVGAA